MTMGWYMVMMDEPSLVGCFIWDQNDSHELVGRGEECAINVPTVDLVETVVAIGNGHGGDGDKFAEFGLTGVDAATMGTRARFPARPPVPWRLSTAPYSWAMQ